MNYKDPVTDFFIGAVISIAIIIIFSVIFLPNAEASEEGWYWEVGAILHSEKYDCPEVCFREDILGRVGISYKWPNGIRLGVEHTSAIGKTERGYGLNGIVLKYESKIGR